MPAIPPVVSHLARKNRAQALLHVARWLVGRGRDLWQQNLTASEREEFMALLTRSRGRRGNLTGEQVARLSRLVVKALFGKDGLDFEDVLAIVSRIRTRRQRRLTDD